MAGAETGAVGGFIGDSASTAVPLDLHGTIGSEKQATALQTDPGLDTLDEPVTTTLLRDLKAVCNKFGHVFVPHKSHRLLHDWDLWGPLVLTVTLALLLRESAQRDQKTLVFTGVFFIIWFGSVVITLNNKLLGGTLSFFQSVCVIGYCVLPLVVSCLALRFFGLVSDAASRHVAVRIIVVAAGFGWAIFASVGFVRDSGPSNRRALIVYPIVLFYFVLSWLIFNDVTEGTLPSPSPPPPLPQPTAMPPGPA